MTRMKQCIMSIAVVGLLINNAPLTGFVISDAYAQPAKKQPKKKRAPLAIPPIMPPTGVVPFNTEKRYPCKCTDYSTMEVDTAFLKDKEACQKYADGLAEKYKSCYILCSFNKGPEDIAGCPES